MARDNFSFKILIDFPFRSAVNYMLGWRLWSEFWFLINRKNRPVTPSKQIETEVTDCPNTKKLFIHILCKLNEVLRYNQSIEMKLEVKRSLFLLWLLTLLTSNTKSRRDHEATIWRKKSWNCCSDFLKNFY